MKVLIIGEEDSSMVSTLRSELNDQSIEVEICEENVMNWDYKLYDSWDMDMFFLPPYPTPKHVNGKKAWKKRGKKKSK